LDGLTKEYLGDEMEELDTGVGFIGLKGVEFELHEVVYEDVGLVDIGVDIS
jgi:hypothetical protein